MCSSLRINPEEYERMKEGWQKLKEAMEKGKSIPVEVIKIDENTCLIKENHSPGETRTNERY